MLAQDKQHGIAQRSSSRDRAAVTHAGSGVTQQAGGTGHGGRKGFPGHAQAMQRVGGGFWTRHQDVVKVHHGTALASQATALVQEGHIRSYTLPLAT